MTKERLPLTPSEPEPLAETFEQMLAVQQRTEKLLGETMQILAETLAALKQSNEFNSDLVHRLADMMAR